MPFVCREAKPEDHQALRQLLELYQYDLSDIWHQRLDEGGRYGYDLTRYEAANDFRAYLCLADGEYVGFALVSPAVLAGHSGRWMEQFFIAKAHRRSGAGLALAEHAFACHPGAWDIGEMAENVRAQAFWRSVAAKVARGEVVERRITEGWWQGVVQSFRVRAIC